MLGQRPNVLAKSSFATIKGELLDQRSWQFRAGTP